MKKILLSLVAVAMAFVANAGKTVTEDFTVNNPEWLPTDYVTTEATYTSPTTNLVWTMTNIKYATFSGSSMLMVGKNTGAVQFPAFDFKVGTITIKTGKSASTSVQVSLYAGETLVETKTLNAKDVDFVYTVPTINQTVGTIYSLKVANDKNAQFQNIVIAEASAEPILSFKETADLAFGTGLNGSHAQIVEILGGNLTEDITIALSGENASKFTLSTTTLGVDGGSFDVTYNGGEIVGSATATLTISSGSSTATRNLTAYTASHAGTKEDPLTVTDVVNLNNANQTTKMWVVGVVANGCASNEGISEDIVVSNIVLTEEGQTSTVPVQLSSGSDARGALNIVDNPENIGATVKVYGLLQAFFTRPGVKSVTDYEIDGSTLGLAAPTFSIEGGIYNVGEELSVEITAEEGAVIYYYIGEEVDYGDATEYTNPIRVTENTTIHAWAIKEDVTSTVSTVTYTFVDIANTAMTVAEALAWIEAGNDATTEQYVVGYITAIEEVSTQFGNATYNIADAVGSTDVLKVYRGKFLNGDKFTAEDQIEVGDKVLIYGKLKSYNGTPEVDANNYIISILEDVSSGIEEIGVDANAPVEYYNLQGVKVANPENGIFIKKQGNKTTKVVL